MRTTEQVHLGGMQKLVLPLVAFLGFTVYSVLVALEHGPLGFVSLAWVGGWTTQVLLDLVLALTGFLVLAGPDARSRGINLWPFAIATIALGSVGMLAYFVRRQLGELRQPAIV